MSATETTSRLRIEIAGMDCADCARTIERRLAATPGVSSCSVQFASGTAEVTYDPVLVSSGSLNIRVRELGYSVANQPAGDAIWVFTISGLDCADCAATLSESVARVSGVSAANVNFATGS